METRGLSPVSPQFPPGGYFVIKNSWSECNGDAGYYYMPVAYFEGDGGVGGVVGDALAQDLAI
jgi:C1A family cysteine protease